MTQIFYLKTTQNCFFTLSTCSPSRGLPAVLPCSLQCFCYFQHPCLKLRNFSWKFMSTSSSKDCSFIKCFRAIHLSNSIFSKKVVTVLHNKGPRTTNIIIYSSVQKKQKELDCAAYSCTDPLPSQHIYNNDNIKVLAKSTK